MKKRTWKKGIPGKVAAVVAVIAAAVGVMCTGSDIRRKSIDSGYGGTAPYRNR